LSGFQSAQIFGERLDGASATKMAMVNPDQQFTILLWHIPIMGRHHQLRGTVAEN